MKPKTRNLKNQKNIAGSYLHRQRIRYEVMKYNPLASPDELKRQKEILENAQSDYKTKRNRFNNLKRNDKSSHFAKLFKNYGFGTKLQWELVNRSKGKVTTKMSDISKDPKYCENAMANFFWRRGKLAAESIYDKAENINPDFRIKNHLSHEAPEINIKISDEIIDNAMKHKISASPDPDGLSMEIWSAVYEKNEKYRLLIRTLFNETFKNSLKIPGLKSHDVRLHPKLDNVTREKDLRPVASLASLPKRMLKITFDQIKKNNKDVFFAENDFSAPGRGTLPAILTTYETLERFHSGSRGVPLPHHETRWLTLDYSNAFATYGKQYVIENLLLKGSARTLVCNAICDQSEFRVRTKNYASVPYQFDVGGPQGQCGSCEIFASIGKTIRIPDVKKDEVSHLIPDKQVKKAIEPKKKECWFVDDRSIAVSSHKDAIQYCQDKIVTSVAIQSKNAGLALNEEKTEIMVIKQKPTKVTKFLGAQMNSELTAKHEQDCTISKVRSSVAAVRATSCLDKPNRIFISKAKIFSCLTYLVFIFCYVSDAQVSELGKQIVTNFKKAAYLHPQIPTVMIEKFLYGMPFVDYCRFRFMKLAKKMEYDGNSLFEDMYEEGRNNRYRPKRACPVGTFSKKYIELMNSFDFEHFAKIHHDSKKQFFSQILKEDAAIKKKFRELRKSKASQL